MKLLLTTLFCACALAVTAQFAVGHSTVSYVDVARANRSIACEMYYPCTAAGEDVPLAVGQFPFIVFGHGFVMDYTAYQNITDALVASGYVMIYVETEGGFAPAHADFGLDLAYVADHFYEENATAGSLFQSHLIDRCAITGHSMGGGATWLAANTSESVDCIAGLAPAETNPSAIAAASNVNVPALVLSGSSDAVTPPADNHIPIYEGTASECKIFVDILNGSHCGYADSGSLCDFGEFGFNGLSRAEQQVITHDLLQAFFDFHLKDLSAGNITLQNYEGTQINTAIQIDCVVSIDETSEQHVFQLYPNPCEDVLVLELKSNVPMQYAITDLSGSTVAMGRVQANSQRFEVNTAYLAAGMYVLQVNTKPAVRFAKR
jgi:dienelactone hydrolase